MLKVKELFVKLLNNIDDVGVFKMVGCLLRICFISFLINIMFEL